MRSTLIRRWSPPRWQRLDDIEMHVVKHFAALGRLRSVRSVAAIVNLLADGWIYPPIAAAIYLSSTGSPWIIIGQAVLAALIAHAIHALLKHSLQRPRPFDSDPLLAPRTRVLDRYSFPSGHCMTMVCVAVPIVHSDPWLWPAAALAVALLAACRLIAAHHYPSDVVAGILIGLSVGLPMSRLVFVN
jgi:undecaprenyl-diphosphatase